MWTGAQTMQDLKPLSVFVVILKLYTIFAKLASVDSKIIKKNLSKTAVKNK